MTITTLKGVYSGGSCALVDKGLMCGKPIVSKGMCNMHRTRLKRHGSPFTVKNNSGGTMMERFLRTTKRVIEGPTTGCLEFTGHIRKQDGYGYFPTIGTRSELAHRWYWEQINGPIPEGMTLDHECHNEAAARGECNAGSLCPHRACIELEHLAVKPIEDNVRASANWYGNKTHCKYGHEFTPENTYIEKGGGRNCRECHRTYERERQRRLRNER